MKKLIVFLMMVLPLGAFAQDVKIAFVNTQEVITAMPELAAMEKQMTEINENYKKELKQMQDEYQKKYSDYIAQQDSLTENIKLRRMQEIQDIQERINNFLQVAEQDVQKKQQELFTPIQQKVQTTIKAVGDEKGYMYIIDPSVLLYKGTSAVDATPFVKSKLGLK
ncbi:MAG: OmpH family outer membrane protein [Tannerellaceae bacterium]|jgi:outer membrane protein|nr:OmpH family outer membrane protein [uncultured Macellibacteroides sp.]MBN2661345.1 OmpH family outer membrane protein [Tannerellaceae bacterium]MBP7486723.1 OmpH family outer membrane protein [Parabacteroides sp.]MCE5226879.1 OmpH family outer membrane protein [Porphyromonadaceae bacterium]MBP8759847.1 OmpH family outer membrane protein [Parabacteroides sp.]MBP9481031.1 OmpH family outer membrane protein [Parabacteroides sp.]